MRKCLSEEINGAAFLDLVDSFLKIYGYNYEILSEDICRLTHILKCQIEPYFWSVVYEVYTSGFCFLSTPFFLLQVTGSGCEIHSKPVVTFLIAPRSKEACLDVSSSLRWGSRGLLVIMGLPEGEAAWRDKFDEGENRENGVRSLGLLGVYSCW